MSPAKFRVEEVVWRERADGTANRGRVVAVGQDGFAVRWWPFTNEPQRLTLYKHGDPSVRLVVWSKEVQS